MRTTPAGRKSTVLVVEHNQDLSQFIAESLAAEYHVITAFDGQQALEKALIEKPALVLMAMMMPGMDGIEMIAQMRKRAELLETPFCFYSTSTMKN